MIVCLRDVCFPPPKADMCGATRNVRFGPKADTSAGLRKVILLSMALWAGPAYRINFIGMLAIDVCQAQLTPCWLTRKQGHRRAKER
jgi:hypothetical protein